MEKKHDLHAGRLLADFVGDTDYLCWTRMQAEAGQHLSAIIARKEIERQAGGGLFFWGVGSAPSRTIRPLARLARRIPVVFSVMRSKPKPVDATPQRVVIWRRYIDKEGAVRPLPDHCIVTSRGDSAQGPKRAHYALVCRSNSSLTLQSGVEFDPTNYRNAGEEGGPVGASQVTALLQPAARRSADKPAYEANMTAELAGSYWVRLTDPCELDSLAQQALAQACGLCPSAWRQLAQDLRQDKQECSQTRSIPILV